jgi:hypothetical protein
MVEPHSTRLEARIGGLMRCCLQTFSEAMVHDEEGEVLPCK